MSCHLRDDTEAYNTNNNSKNDPFLTPCLPKTKASSRCSTLAIQRNHDDMFCTVQCSLSLFPTATVIIKKNQDPY